MSDFLIPCIIERSGFSTERVFKVELSGNVTYRNQNTGFVIGTAHVSHLKDSERQSLDDNTPEYGEELPGFVRCEKIRDLAPSWAVVEVPSSDIIHVNEGELVPSD